MSHQQSEQRAHSRGRQCRKNGYGMDVALVQNSEYDVNRQQGGRNKNRLIGPSFLVRSCSALKASMNRGGKLDFVLCLLDNLSGLTKRNIGRQIEGNGSCRELALVGDCQRGVRRAKMRDGGERYHRSIR